MAVESFDVCIIGAGIIGSSVAMGLAQRKLRVLAVDLDLSGRLSSSEKNAGGVRATWWQPVNIRLCRASIEYYESIAKEVGFQQKGYLWMYNNETWPEALSRVELQRSLNHPIQILSAAQVSERVPEIDRLQGIEGATFSVKDGLINPNLLKEHYRADALEHGARFMDRTWVIRSQVGSDGVRLECWQSDHSMTDPGLIRLMTQDGFGESAPGKTIEVRAETIVIAAGAWSGRHLELLGLRNYSEAIRRQICLVDNRSTNLEPHGMIVDTSGLYFHHEGPYILAGYSPPEEPPGYHFGYDGDAFFENEIWPRLYTRMSCMERLRHVTGWAGLYEVSPDRSAILGQAVPHVYEAHSFSGRGVMQSFGAGQALSDLIAFGKYDRLDASALSRSRFDRGEQVFEALHI